MPLRLRGPQAGGRTRQLERKNMHLTRGYRDMSRPFDGLNVYISGRRTASEGSPSPGSRRTEGVPSSPRGTAAGPAGKDPSAAGAR